MIRSINHRKRELTLRGSAISLILFRTMLFILFGTTIFSAADPVQVETTGPKKGVLFIHGGGKLDYREFVSLVKKSTAQKQPVIRIITTAQGKRRAAGLEKGTPFRMVEVLKKGYKLKHVTELYTLSKEEANTPAFFKQIDSADVVYISGGNQSYLTDAFLGTESFAALERLLERGGVIGGASAGAQVMSSFMTRGDYTRRKILGDKKHQEGFAFVKNSVFDVHVEERNREKHLLQVFRAKKSQLQDKSLNPLDLLGIGIDQGTAIVVTQDQFRVMGSGQIYLFNARQWKDDSNSWTYQTLPSGTLFNMKLRQVIEPPTKFRETSSASQ